MIINSALKHLYFTPSILETHKPRNVVDKEDLASDEAAFQLMSRHDDRYSCNPHSDVQLFVVELSPSCPTPAVLPVLSLGLPNTFSDCILVLHILPITEYSLSYGLKHDHGRLPASIST